LQTNQSTLNPVKQLRILADHAIPVCIIHGTDDQVVPIDANSMALEKTYQEAGKGELVQLIRVEGQGHNFWEGFFHCQELVTFLIAQAKSPVELGRP
jgi:pimeloyl-ACP methyl ester carboxylesterase